MAQLVLPCGRVTFFDDEDEEFVLMYEWFVVQAHNNNYPYVTRKQSKHISGDRLHRLLIKAPKKVRVDHKDRDGLNNRKSNLRLATAGQNAANAKWRGRRYRGAYWNKSRNRWQSQIQIDGRQIHLGVFATEIEAALAWDAAATEAWGEFALLNFPA